MDHTSPAFLLLVLAVAALFSTIAAAISFALARWDGATVPAAFTRGGVTFAACLTLCLAALSVINRAG